MAANPAILSLETTSASSYFGHFHQDSWFKTYPHTMGNLRSADFSFLYIFGGLECVAHSFAYVAHSVFLRDVRIKQARYQLSHPSSYLATHLPI